MGRSTLRVLGVVAVLWALVVGLAPADAVARATPRPVVTSLSRTVGPFGQRVTLTIHGRNFQRHMNAWFGASRVQRVTWVSSRTLRVRTPYGAGDRTYTTHVRVVGVSGGLSARTSKDRYTFVHAPYVTGLSVHRVPSTGGPVTITGLDFRDVRGVTVGSAALRSVRRVSDRVITGVLPPVPPRAVRVVVHTAYGASPPSGADDLWYVARPSITALSPNEASVDGGGIIDLAGSGLDEITGVTVGGVRADFGIQRTGSVTEVFVVAPAHAAGPAPVVVRSVGGSSVVTTRSTVTYLAHPPNHWTVRPELDRWQGWLGDVDCPSVSLCVTIDEHTAVVRTGGTWQSPQRLTEHALQAVSCADDTHCTAVDDTGCTWLWDGSSWSAGARAATERLVDVSCPTPSDCVAVGSGRVVREVDGVWQAAVASPLTDVHAVACPTVTSCVAVGGRMVSTFDGTTWSTPVAPLARASYLAAVDCVSSSSCLVVDISVGAATFDGSVWTAAPPLGDAARYQRFRDVSCVVDACVVVTDDLTTARYRDGQWSSPTALPFDGNEVPYVRVSCAAAGSCVATDPAGRVSDGDGVAPWSSPVVVRTALGVFASLSCPADDHCLASTSQGTVVDLDASGRVVGETAVLPRFRTRTSLSCASVSDCVLVSWLGGSAHWDGTTWSLVDSPALIAVSCAAPGDCVGVDDHGAAAHFDGSRWSLFGTVHGVGVIRGLSCGAPASCVVAGDGGAAVLDGTTWRTTLTLSANQTAYAPMNLVSCAAAGECLFVDALGTAHQLSGGRWLAPETPPSGPWQPESVSCTRGASGTASVRCVVTSDFAFRLLRGTTWSVVEPYVDRLGYNYGAQVACTGSGHCLAAQGAVVRVGDVPAD